ncbi:MAG: hypothetical protein U0529_14340 [Thermoanaerobaculia bacterium]
MRITPSAAALLLFTATLLSACQKAEPVVDWRYTKWHMTAAEVRTASGGKAQTADASDQAHDRSRDNRVLLKAPVTWQGLGFMAYYAFGPTDGLLESVTLELQNASASSNAKLLSLLERQYGQPYSGHEDPSTKLLVWGTTGEQVTFIKLSDPQLAVGAPATSVSYQPLISSR